MLLPAPTAHLTITLPHPSMATVTPRLHQLPQAPNTVLQRSQTASTSHLRLQPTPIPPPATATAATPALALSLRPMLTLKATLLHHMSLPPPITAFLPQATRTLVTPRSVLSTLTRLNLLSPISTLANTASTLPLTTARSHSPPVPMIQDLAGTALTSSTRPLRFPTRLTKAQSLSLRPVSSNHILLLV